LTSGRQKGDVLTVGSPFSAFRVRSQRRTVQAQRLSLPDRDGQSGRTDRYWNAIVGHGGRKASAVGAGPLGPLRQITPRALTEALAAGGGEVSVPSSDDEEDRLATIEAARRA
jgi:hypothetical protein